MKTLEAQLAEMRRELEQLKRDIARKPAREAAPLAPRHGRYVGVTREDFTKGTDEFLEVDVWIWSETDQQWRKANVVIFARDWFLQDDEEVAKHTKVKIEWYETTWVATAIYCTAEGEESQFYSSPGAELSGESVGYSPGYYGGGSESYASAFESPGYSGSDAGAMTWQD